MTEGGLMDLSRNRGPVELSEADSDYQELIDRYGYDYPNDDQQDDQLTTDTDDYYGD